jgi:hypothetical protein
MLRAHAATGPAGSAAIAASRPAWSDELNQWIRMEGPWWASSFIFHMLLMCVLMLVGSGVAPEDVASATVFNGQPKDVEPERVVPELMKLDIVSPPSTPPEDDWKKLTAINVDTPMAPLDRTLNPLAVEQPRDVNNEPVGRIGALDGLRDSSFISFDAIGDVIQSPRGPGPRFRIGHPGREGDPFGDIRETRIAHGRRLMEPGGERLPYWDRAVRDAIEWLVRHQSSDGSWSLAGYRTRCQDSSCTGPGSAHADAAATAMGVLPLLAAGLTQNYSKGPYGQTVRSGLSWLLRHQKANGDLSAGASQPMYSHGLATIALCEAYGMTKDPDIGRRAQLAIDFIQAAQNRQTGGWRYRPGEEGDTSVVGWQVMALKSGQLAGLVVDYQVMDRARLWLKSVSQGSYGGQFSYQPHGAATAAMTAAGLLCSQYLGAQRSDPPITDGSAFLLSHLPESHAARNLYGWYYAGQVMHNLMGSEWDAWYRHTRRLLADDQDHQGCAAGSWDPDRPARDAWGPQGGRLMTTSLATLTLELPYRYSPLYKIGIGVGEELLGGSSKP